MGPLTTQASWRLGFLVSITLLLLAAMATVGLGWVKVKMLPFDNKSEFQIILNMPEGSALERTAQAAREIAAAVRHEPEVTDYQIYVRRRKPFSLSPGERAGVRASQKHKSRSTTPRCPSPISRCR